MKKVTSFVLACLLLVVCHSSVFASVKVIDAKTGEDITTYIEAYRLPGGVIELMAKGSENLDFMSQEISNMCKTAGKSCKKLEPAEYLMSPHNVFTQKITEVDKKTISDMLK